MLAFYRGVTNGAAPLVRLYLARRVRAGKEDPGRLSERLGRASLPRPAGPVAWIHAASVGESLSVLSLVERLRRERPGLGVLVTTGTVTSARILDRRLPDGAVHQFVPVDRAAWVRRFLDHWRPDLALWVESEFWPNLLSEIGARGIPFVLVNARISAGSYRGWRRVPGFARRLLANFDLCLAQTEDDARKLERLGAPRVRCHGNLKFAAPPLPCDDAARAAFAGQLGGRTMWLAASTHRGEEAVIAAAHARLSAARPGLLTVIVPRHPTRGPAIAADLAAAGHAVALRSRGEPVTPAVGIHVADGMGELGLFYRLAPVAFIGGSLIRHGGQNPLEAAHLGCAVVHGPHMSNFHAIARDLARAGASAEAGDADSIAAAVEALLANEALRARRIAAARAVAEANRGILDAVWRELEPFLDAPPAAAPVRVRHARA